MNYFDKKKVGAKVHYTSPHGKIENGIVKSLSEDESAAFVVYNCGGDWDNYKNYTAAHTDMKRLTYGWVDESGNLLKEFCNHHYIPTNAKYQSIHQMKCQDCGDIIN